MYSQPPTPGQGSYPRTGGQNIERLREIAASHRQVMYCVLGQIGIAIGNVIVRQTQMFLLALVIIAAALGLVVFMLLSVSRLTKALGESSILYIILMFIPCVSLLALLSLSSKATAHLKSAGITVGLLGADPKSIF